MRAGVMIFLVVLSSLAGVGCGAAPRAELEEARAGVAEPRAELAEARAELAEAREGVDEAARELKMSRRARLRARRRPTVGGPSSSPAADLEAEEALREAMAAAITCVDDLRCTVTRTFVEHALGNPAALSRQARVVPHVKDGVSDGLRFYAIRRGTVPELIGLRNGDTLAAINDLPLTGVDAALEAYTKLRDEDRLTLKLIRKGEPLELQIEITDKPGGPTPPKKR